ncbi:MAG: SDR family oxidoreductase [Acidobacteria bacterium]|nr:SDR family oxidoreductase [Acidobacteriota bacterium]MCB9378657.1 SDR family oxidoreductase [Holophagales bacterium]
MRVLVTGNHGYIGSVLMPLLAEAGHEPVGLDTDLYAGCLLGPPPEEPWPSLRRDVREIERSDLEGFEAVVHLAALSNDPLGDLDPELTYAINLEGSIRLARLAREVGVSRFLFASSCSNYGASGEALLDETAELRPITPYAISKVRFEAALAELAAPGFSTVALRNGTAYGVSPRLRVDIVLNNLVAWAVTTGKIVLQSDGTPWRPIVHVEDIARTFVHLLGVPREVWHGQAYNVGRTSENYRIRDLAEFVAEAVPGCELTFAEGCGPDPRNYRVTCERLATTFPGLELRWTAREGARQLAAAYQAAGMTRERFEGPTYKRLGEIRRLLADGRLGPDLRWRTSAA